MDEINLLTEPVDEAESPAGGQGREAGGDGQRRRVGLGARLSRRAEDVAQAPGDPQRDPHPQHAGQRSRGEARPEAPAREVPLRHPLAGLEEDAPGVRSPRDEDDQVDDLAGGEPDLALGHVAVALDLLLDGPAEPQPAGKTLTDVLLLQGLAGGVRGPERLEQPERKQGRDALIREAIVGGGGSDHRSRKATPRPPDQQAAGREVGRGANPTNTRRRHG
jgi:hypothetical protein